MLMEVTSIHPDAAVVLEKFAESGGKIVFIGVAPSRSVGLKDYRENNNKVENIIGRIINKFSDKCKIVTPPEKELLNWFQGIQNEFKIIPPVKFSYPDFDVSQIQYVYKNKEIYFFINSNKEKRHTVQAEFTTTGNKIPWLWDPETGKKYLYPYDKQKNKLNIDLMPAESKLIIFDDETKGKPMPRKDVNYSSAFILNGPWDVEFDHIDGSIRTTTLTELIDLKDHSDFKTFAGNIIYKKTLNLKSENSFSFIDLGKVYGISQVFINNNKVGVKWYGEHFYDCQGWLHNKNITLKIIITTIVGNYCKSLKENLTCQKWTKNKPFASMGLVGPVKLLKL